MIRFIDLFCGIGGFRIAMEQACAERSLPATCVFSSDLDPDAQAFYHANFGEEPHGDITKIPVATIPDHDVLFAGFPCQPFSICGDRRGFDDIRGTLFFDIARILETKRPAAFVLENVKMLVGHDKGRTLRRILEIVNDLGYKTDYKVLNALDFGLPQKRERVFIVGFHQQQLFSWPQSTIPMRPLEDILEQNVPEFYYASQHIRTNRKNLYQGKPLAGDTIWHENKGGHISAYPFSCALRAGASYNYLLVNGERRLTEREMLRLQGFPDNFKIVRGYSATRRLAGNSVAIPCVKAVVHAILDALEPQGDDHSQQLYAQKPTCECFQLNIGTPLIPLL
jgi:DNA (cytosine-5)-methyltransferase 1